MLCTKFIGSESRLNGVSFLRRGTFVVASLASLLVTWWIKSRCGDFVVVYCASGYIQCSDTVGWATGGIFIL